MTEKDIHAPVNFKGVMVSSTFTDLEKHRAAMIKAIEGQDLKPMVMEFDSAKADVDVLDSSLQMVRKASAYIGIISCKYGQIPECTERNPDRLSLTELEFKEAQYLKLPMLIFIMGEDHDVKRSDVEADQEKIMKLEKFTKNVKLMRLGSLVHRVYKVFNSLPEFEVAATKSIADLRSYLEEQDEPPPPAQPDLDSNKPDIIPTPPAFYAEPRYIGSHDFVGRKAQLDTLSDWAAPADLHPILLFEAIGGMGKSMLTWEWITNHATSVRKNWAGIFWYSFYEKGAVMADFCRRALAYMTSQPLDDFRKMKTPELGDLLLHQLQARPWLIVFDGLERVLVAYHRYDAAQITDEEAGTAVDQIAQRNPCNAIRPEDDELLHGLVAAAPSKLLLTSRLIPRILLNAASQPIPGILHERLPGLRPSEAEELFRACGITGESENIRNYLQSHCDSHPLVIGVLAGLINDYLPDRGNFDAWASDPNGGNRLNLADLNLVQKRNNILKAALAALDDKSRQLLSTLALLSNAVDYPILSALNPHLPPEPEEIDEPAKPEENWRWNEMSDDEKEQAQQECKAALQRREKYKQTLKSRLESQEFLDAPRNLSETVRDLESRGLLQYDQQSKLYDLHPVVRGIVAGGLRQEEKEHYGQSVVDHFSQQQHSPWTGAKTLEDVRNGLHVVRTLLLMGRHQQAAGTLSGDLATALLINLEANVEILSLLRPLFFQGWATLPKDLDNRISPTLSSHAANALHRIGEIDEALVANVTSLLAIIGQKRWGSICGVLLNISSIFYDKNLLAKMERHLLLALNVASQLNDEFIFRTRLSLFDLLYTLGQMAKAEAMWQLCDSMGRDWPYFLYRSGGAEYYYACFLFYQGELKEINLNNAENLAKKSKDHALIRFLHNLRGKWRFEQGEYALSIDSFNEALRMAREVGITDASVEAQIALARFHLGQLSNPCNEAERLAKAKEPFHRILAELWFAIGDHELAKKHTLLAYEWAWSDGEPYVHRYELNKTCDLLKKLGMDIPDLPPYDPAKDEKLPWEDEVAAAIDELRTENEAKKAAKEADEKSEEG